jgi:hypothetical protein
MKPPLKKLTYIILLFVFAFNANGQSWLWGRQGSNYKSGSGGDGEGNTVATNTLGDVFIGGIFVDTIAFGNDTLGCPGIHSGQCFYIAKYDAMGNLKWANQSSINYGVLNSVAADKEGNCYATGSISPAGVIFSNDTAQQGGFFLIKYDKNGKVAWLKNAATNSGEGGAVITDSKGNVYVSGSYMNGTKFGSFVSPSPYYAGIFTAKFDSSGNVIWVNYSNNPNGYDYPNTTGLAIDSYNNVYVAGNFGDTISFGSIILANSGKQNGFFVKIDSLGNPLWAKESQATAQNMINSLAVDKKGSVYLTGGFKDSLTFDNKTIYNPLTNLNAYFVKYSSEGKLIWLKALNRIMGTTFEGYSLSIDGANNIYMSIGGPSSNSIISWEYDTIKCYAATDASFIIRFDTSGIDECGVSVTSGGDDNNAVAVDESGKYIYFEGDIWAKPVVFGNDTIGPTNNASEFPFVARWQSCEGTEGIDVVSSQINYCILFPNPNNGTFTIQTSGITSKSEIEVYNMVGEKVYNETLRQAQGDNKIDITDQPAGIYLYRVISESGNLIGSGKFVIEK